MLPSHHLLKTGSLGNLLYIRVKKTCFAYNELMDFIGTDSQLTGIVAVGFANEAPAKRPRKPFEEIVEYR